MLNTALRGKSRGLPARVFLSRTTLVLFATIAVLAVRGVAAQEQPLLSDPGEVGPYAVGHTAYSLVDANNGNRPVLFSVWYPVDPRTITSSTPPAQYPLDPYTGTTYLLLTLSTDWEPLGYDPAYEGPAPSKHGPFPLVVFSVGATDNSWMHLFQGARLASHGYIFAAIDHYADCQWPWSPCDDLLTVAVNRPRDVSFVSRKCSLRAGLPGNCYLTPLTPIELQRLGIPSAVTPPSLSLEEMIWCVTHCTRLFMGVFPFHIPRATACQYFRTSA
jgi:platelet-activating factor acetylhydrolase isoform II